MSVSSLHIESLYQRVGRLSMYRDGADLPRASYIGKACTRLNSESFKPF